MTTVPLWYHVPVVLALLGLQCSTVYWALRKIRDLQAALVAKRVLLGAFEGSFEKDQWLACGDTMTLQDASGNILEITSTNATNIHVKVFDR